MSDDSAPSADRTFFVQGKAGRLQVSDGGRDGPAVLFVPGLGCRIDCWRAQLEHLRPWRRAVAYDQRGHGASDRASDGVYTVAALAEDLAAVVAALGLDRFFLVGHSFSGAVVSAYAAQHPERVLGAVYADAVGDLRALPPQAIEAQLQRDASLASPDDLRAAFLAQISFAARPQTRERVLAAVAQLDPPAFAALRKSLAAFDGKGALARYPGPRLAIDVQGNDFPAMFASLSPQAPRIQIAFVSHWLMMDDPDAFHRALDPFIGFLRAEHGSDPIPGAGGHTIGPGPR